MRKCGVYKIVCLVTNKVYIGSSVNIYYRWTVHKRNLQDRIHFSKHLQSAWIKYGKRRFAFSIIRECYKCHLHSVEQRFINMYDACNPQYGFNTSKIAGKSSRSGIPITLISPKGKTVNAINGRALADKYKIPHCMVCSVANGSRLHYRGWKLPSAEINYNPHMILAPTGKKYVFHCVADFAKEHKLSQGALYHLISKRAYKHKGWKII